MTNNLVSERFLEVENKSNSSSMRHISNHESNNSNYTKQQEHKQHNKHQQHHHQSQQSISSRYNVNLQYDPITPEAGKETKLILSVTDQMFGDPIKEYELLHDKLMHLIIVSEDLTYFAHIHPVLEDNRESFTISHIFPESGRYKLWIDFKPKNGNQTLVAFTIKITGSPLHKPSTLVYDRKYTKESADGKYQVSLKVPKKIVANNDVDIVFSILDVVGKSVIDLEPLMGAGGHSVIISSDIREFLHVHPTQEVDRNWNGGPDISFRTNFPKPGLYKAWGQFQHQGNLLIVDFILEVI
jgi:hypothetical protein